MSARFDLELPPGTLEGARAGARAARREIIYRAFEPAVYNLARRICGDADAARDVTQDCFLRAFASLGQFRGEAPFGRWLRAIAATQALMRLRAGRRFLELFEDSLADVAAPPADASNADLERALALLAPLPRAVAWLYHVEGYTHAEIARMSRRTVSFSKSQLSRAHQKLRELLGVAPQTVSNPPARAPATLEVATR